LDDSKLNIDLDELFRKKLESSELVPGEMAGKNLMRRLGRKEFVRFNPARFNIYYLGGIVAAGIAATILFTPVKETGPKENITPPDRTETIVPGNVSDMVVLPKKDLNTPSTEKGKINAEGNNTPATAQGKENNLQSDKAAAAGKTPDDLNKRAEADTLQKTSYIREKVSKDNLTEATIEKKPFADFRSSATSGCLPLKIRFLNRSVSYDSCRWIFGDGGYSSSRDAEWIFKTPGEYKVTLKVYGAGGYESVFSETIVVHPKPVASFKSSPEKPIIPDDVISFTNYSKDAVKYSWDFGDGTTSDTYEPEHAYPRFNSYTVRLIAFSQYGCSDTLTVRNAFPVSGSYIDFPNAFIPNPDGPAGGYYSTKSDESARIFHPVTSGVSEFQMRIFSKTGVLIFESNDINIGWDGYNKGKLCEPGVYVWKVRGKFKNGEPFAKTGDITIIRN
jgi:PKD repeat protein